MRNFIAKEGLLYGIIPFGLGFFFLFKQVWFAGVLFFLISLFIFLFFRYPDRTVSGDLSKIYSPADGRVVFIGDEHEDAYFNDTVSKISIFMSIFNVHINYSPINGVVELIKYSPGKFEKANIVPLKESNENNYIGISDGVNKVGVRQVAGLIARRIVCNCNKGDALYAGKRFGLIKFGSRVDVYFPKNYNVCIKLNETVRAGRTVLAGK